MNRYEVNIKASVESCLFLEAESASEACDKATFLFLNTYAEIDAEITDICASEEESDD